jgi:hypothetical protein
MNQELKIFEPDNEEELLRGWLLHAHKGRDRHDETTRHFESRRYWLGVPAAILSAIVGASVFASLSELFEQSNLSDGVVLFVGFLSILAAALAGLQTTLNYAERAESHRVTGVKYKKIVRELEYMLTGSGEHLMVGDDSTEQLLLDIRNRLDLLEEEAPVVPNKIYTRVEHRYSATVFVPKANQLY